MKATCLVFCVALSACGGDDGTGDTDDTLPKRGERDTDPTIVAVTAGCEFTVSQLKISVSAADPAGVSNLASCAVMVANQGDANTDFDAGDSTCYLYLPGGSCTVGMTYKLDLTVSNKTAGVTTASVTVVAD